MTQIDVISSKGNLSVTMKSMDIPIAQHIQVINCNQVFISKLVLFCVTAET